MSFDKLFGPLDKKYEETEETNVDEDGSFEDVKAWALSQKKKIHKTEKLLRMCDLIILKKNPKF